MSVKLYNWRTLTYNIKQKQTLYGFRSRNISAVLKLSSLILMLFLTDQLHSYSVRYFAYVFIKIPSSLNLKYTELLIEVTLKQNR